MSVYSPHWQWLVRILRHCQDPFQQLSSRKTKKLLGGGKRKLNNGIFHLKSASLSIFLQGKQSLCNRDSQNSQEHPATKTLQRKQSDNECFPVFIHLFHPTTLTLPWAHQINMNWLEWELSFTGWICPSQLKAREDEGAQHLRERKLRTKFYTEMLWEILHCARPDSYW